MEPTSTFTQIGATARECLANGRRGKVLAAFSKAIYLLTESGELFWIATNDVPMHRRCAQIRPPLPRFSAGWPFHVQNHLLTIDRNFSIAMGEFHLWVSPQVKHVLKINSLPMSILSFYSRLDGSQANGFGNFIPHILSLANNEFAKPLPVSTDPILRFARGLVVEAARACLENQPARLPSIANELIGLGAGLTPSGDDFFGGLLFAFHHLQTAYPKLDFSDYRFSIEPYRSCTHPISFGLLEDHACGHAIAPLHCIINGILSGEPFERISPSVSELARIGHSTGWDLLTGLLTGLLVTFRNHNFTPSLQISSSNKL